MSQGLKAAPVLSGNPGILEDDALTDGATHRPLTVVNTDTVDCCTEIWVIVTIETSVIVFTIAGMVNSNDPISVL